MPSLAYKTDNGSRWQQAFLASIQRQENAEPLKQAALAGKLATWTKRLTFALVQSCQTLGWSAAAKGHSLNLLPQLGQEYLGIDVMAFESRAVTEWPGWQFPVEAVQRDL